MDYRLDDMPMKGSESGWKVDSGTESCGDAEREALGANCPINSFVSELALAFVKKVIIISPTINDRSMGIRHRQHVEKKHQTTSSEYSKRAVVIMGSADDIEQGRNNLRRAHPQVKQIMGSYQVRRRLSLAGIGVALIAAVAIVAFVTSHMNGKSSYHIFLNKGGTS
eukprot:scaffold4530_cov146-Skeletonema_menzelii.AAC.8